MTCQPTQKLVLGFGTHSLQIMEPIKGSIKKNAYKAVRLTAWVAPPPLPRSGQENVKIFRQVVIFGVILPFYKG